MSTINIGGQPPSQPRSASDPGGRDYARMQAQSARQSASDYAAAERQAGRKQSDESAAWRQYEAAEKAHYSKMESLMRQEERAYEAQIRDQARLQHRFSTLSARGRDPLTPSSRSAFIRSANTLEFQAQQHAQRYGSSPFAATAFADMRRGVGDEATAHKVARTLRLGNLGQMAGVSRNFTDLARVESQLKRIDSDLKKSAAFAESPSAQANLERQKNAMLTARSRVAEGISAHSPTVNRIGRAIGKAGLGIEAVAGAAAAFAAEPVVGAAVALATAPWLLNRARSAFVSMEAPYLDYVNSTSDIAKGGRFAPKDLRKLLLPTNGVHAITPGLERPDWAKALGLAWISQTI